MQYRLDSITTELSLCCNSSSLRIADNTNEDGENNVSIINAKLYQNNPNPFKKQTFIRYEVPKISVNSYILVFDLQGTLIKNIPIHKYGKGKVIISGNELKAGMYVYSLIVNKQIIDTKRMILLD